MGACQGSLAALGPDRGGSLITGSSKLAKAKRAAGSRRGGFAVAGVAAVAAAGLAAAPAQASGRIYACYSKKSHVLKYSKGSKCAHGSKSLSWGTTGPQGAMGAQGAQGSQGAQGPAGVTQIYYNYNDSSVFIAKSVYTFLDEVVPTTTGEYQVNLVDDIFNADKSTESVTCVARNNNGQSIPNIWTTVYASANVAVADTGVLSGSATNPIMDSCFATGTDLEAGRANINAALAKSAIQSSAKPAAASRHGRPAQRFRKQAAAQARAIKALKK